MDSMENRLLLGFPLKLTIVLLSSLTASARPFLTATPPINAIYQFGDSVSDTGNWLRENRSTTSCSTFPYGESYFHYSTGRCSDGLIMADYYATAFGLEFLNPYLQKDANFSNGVNFAVVGATALDVAFLESNNISVYSYHTNTSLSVQLGWFRQHLNSICTSPSECERTLGRSLIMMEAIGGNDYYYAFTEYSLEVAYDLVPYVVQSTIDVVKQMIIMGVVNVVVPSVFPFGCLPYYLTMGHSTDPDRYDELGCLIDYNRFGEYHNRLLLKGIQELQMECPNATLIYADYYFAITSLLRNVTSLGFEEEELLVTCCGYGENPYNFNSSEMCGTLGVPVCPHPEKRVIWDGLHFTQHFYMYLSNWMLKYAIIPGLSRTSSS